MADRFAAAVTRQAVAQIAVTLGCQQAYPSVLDALTDLVREFIIALGLSVQSKVEEGGRTAASVLDVLEALEMYQLKGTERVELDWRALRSFLFKDVSKLEQAEDPFRWHQPFHTTIPPFPVRKRPKPSPLALNWHNPQPTMGSFTSGAIRRPSYVPEYLPPFPPDHTYRKTAIKASTKTDDPAVIHEERLKTRQLVYNALQKTSATALEGEVVEGDGGLGGWASEGEPKQNDQSAVGGPGEAQPSQLPVAKLQPNLLPVMPPLPSGNPIDNGYDAQQRLQPQQEPMHDAGPEQLSQQQQQLLPPIQDNQHQQAGLSQQGEPQQDLHALEELPPQQQQMHDWNSEAEQPPQQHQDALEVQQQLQQPPEQQQPEQHEDDFMHEPRPLADEPRFEEELDLPLPSEQPTLNQEEEDRELPRDSPMPDEAEQALYEPTEPEGEGQEMNVA